MRLQGVRIKKGWIYNYNTTLVNATDLNLPILRYKKRISGI